MGCKIRWIMGFMVFLAALLVSLGTLLIKTAENVEEVGGYLTEALFISICVAGAFMYVTSALRIGASPYAGGRRLRAQARKVAADTGMDISAAAKEIYDQGKAEGKTFPRAEPNSRPRPVLVDRAHITHIRASEPKPAPVAVPRPGYDVRPAKTLPASMTWNELATEWLNKRTIDALHEE